MVLNIRTVHSHLTNQQITNKLDENDDEKSGGSSVIIERQMPDGNQENEK